MLDLLKGGWSHGGSSTADAAKVQLVAIQPRLDRLAGEIGRNSLENTEHARDRHELGVELLAENPCADVIARSSHRAPSKCAIDVHAAIGHHLRTGTHHRCDDEVSIARVNALA